MDLEKNTQSTNTMRLIITGDAGRGKTTLARRISKELKIPYYSTDDIYWKVKYTTKADEEEGIKKIKKIMIEKDWIIEGTSRHLILPCLDKADKILFLGHKHLSVQCYHLLRRHMNRKNEKFCDLLRLIRHQFYKKYKWSYMRNTKVISDHLPPYRRKVVELKTFKEIREYESKARSELRSMKINN